MLSNSTLQYAPDDTVIKRGAIDTCAMVVHNQLKYILLMKVTRKPMRADIILFTMLLSLSPYVFGVAYR